MATISDKSDEQTGQTPKYSVSLANLAFSYTGRQQDQVLNILRWDVAAGEQVFLYGPSGSGKSTLLNLLSGVLKPTEGRIGLLGEDFSAMGASRRDRFRARHIGVVFQQFNLIPYLSVLDNIKLAHHFAHDSQAGNVAKRAQNLFEGLQLDTALLKRPARNLSVGQQQRVAIARALINTPELLIADEPTSALDSDARDGFMKVLLELVRSNGSTLIFVSHDKHLARHFSQTIDLTQLNTAKALRHAG